jgi:hypothetical protein
LNPLILVADDEPDVGTCFANNSAAICVRPGSREFSALGDAGASECRTQVRKICVRIIAAIAVKAFRQIQELVRTEWKKRGLEPRLLGGFPDIASPLSIAGRYSVEL